MSEVVGVTLLFLGILILLWGLGWLTLLARRARGTMMAAAIWIVGPFGPLLYGLVNFSRARRPLMVVLLGLILGALPFAYDHAHELIFGLGERERILNGERHLVLTGWDRPTYDILKTRTDTVVLELANADVTDSTLEMLRSFTRLKELTLNDSAITDASFETLKQLQSLESLRLARTKITKDGLAEFLSAPPEKLREIDVSGNSISSSVLRKWKNQDSENRRYVN